MKLKKFLSFINENTSINQSVIYKLISILDNKKIETEDEFRKSGREVGPYFSYEIINDYTIYVVYGYSDYEDGCDNTLKITVSNDNVSVDATIDGDSIDGSYKDEQHFDFNDIKQFWQYLLEEIN
jgi:hypothetical protein